MIDFLLETLLIALGAGIFAAVYYKVLRKEAPAVVQKFMADHETAWWIKPVWECACCISGQCGLWSYMLLEWLPAFRGTPIGEYDLPTLVWLNNPAAYVFGLIMCITGSVFFGMLAVRALSWLQKTTHNYA